MLPSLQKQFGFFNEEPLRGDVRLATDTVLSYENWFEGRYAHTKEQFINDNFGFRSWFVRLRNQLYFSAFDHAYAKEVILGKKGFLYESRYLAAYAGKDYIGEKHTEELFEKLKLVQDSLAKRGVTLVLLFAPGKATYFPEYIPDSYYNYSEKTNYLEHIKFAKKFGINHIDLNGWFLQLKSKSKFPLYPQTGTHWSTYGMYIAFDSISKYLDHMLHKKLPKYKMGSVEMRDPTLIWEDIDIEAGLNLLSTMPHYKMAYPNITWPDTQNCYRPRVLTIGDSYWGRIYDLHLPKIVYLHPEFWSYNQFVFNYSPVGMKGNSIDLDSKISGKSGISTDLDLKTSVEQKDVVFIIGSEASLRFMGWDFIEEVYNMYKNGPSLYSSLQASRKKTLEMTLIKDNIMSNEDWYIGIKRFATATNISVDSSLQAAALGIYADRHKADPSVKK